MGRIGRIMKKFFCFPMATVALLLTSCTNILVHDAEEDGVDGMAIDFRTPALTGCDREFYSGQFFLCVGVVCTGRCCQ